MGDDTRLRRSALLYQCAIGGTELKTFAYPPMSTRGINFLDRWIANNLPETAKPDAISISEFTHKLFADAKALGIKRDEIDEEVDSLYRTLVDAVVHFDP